MTMAYTFCGFWGETAIPMRPMLAEGAGSPPPRRFHVSPPSVDLYTPEPTPPYVRRFGWRRWSHMAAYTTLGFVGSMARSTAPVVELAPGRTWVQCRPPSVLRYTPRWPP